MSNNPLLVPSLFRVSREICRCHIVSNKHYSLLFLLNFAPAAFSFSSYIIYQLKDKNAAERLKIIVSSSQGIDLAPCLYVPPAQLLHLRDDGASCECGSRLELAGWRSHTGVVDAYLQLRILCPSQRETGTSRATEGCADSCLHGCEDGRGRQAEGVGTQRQGARAIPCDD